MRSEAPAGVDPASVHRYVAFSTDPSGGNPAGVVLDASALDEHQMLSIAAWVGFSETAFLTERGAGIVDVRYFSPLAEVSFCGHATIASAVALASHTGAAAAAFGGYLRDQGHVEAPAAITILQGHDLGRPSTLLVGIPVGQGTGITVTGTAVPLGD